MKVQNKVMLVTGGGSGIGRELVLNLVAKGARIAMVDINASTLQETAELAGNKRGNLSTHVVNITERDAVAALPEEVTAIHGAIDGIINNAGIIQPFVRINELDFDAIERVMNVNFYGTLYMTKAFLPHLLGRPQAHIVNVSSMGGFLPVPGQTIYGASKAAVKLFTEGLYSELLDTNVQVTIVFPGAVGTNISRNSGVDMGQTAESDGSQRSFQPMEASKAAEIIVEGMEKNQFRVLVGGDARTMDFLYRLAPKRAAKIIFNQMKSLLAQE